MKLSINIKAFKGEKVKVLNPRKAKEVWEEGKANALLISKAPEMLEEHITDIDQLEVWIEWLSDLENDEKYIGIIDTMKKCINVKKELIK